MSPTITTINVGGFRFYFNSTEGSVAHVHVDTPSGTVMWWLGKVKAGAVSLKHKESAVKAADIRKSKRYVEQHYDVIMDAWRTFFAAHRTANRSRLFVYAVMAKGLWLYYDTELYWIDFTTYPIFRYGTDDEIRDVQLIGDGGFYWPALDADLCARHLQHPERYPMRARHPRETENWPKYR
jgi:hypothetical protein